MIEFGAEAFGRIWASLHTLVDKARIYISGVVHAWVGQILCTKPYLRM